MKTITEFVQLVGEKYCSAAEFKYIYPSLYIVCVDDLFKGVDQDARELVLVEKLDMGVDELEKIRSFGVVEICLLTPEERRTDFSFLDTENGSHHWLEWFNPLLWKAGNSKIWKKVNDSSASTRAIHFYGYKGGQARSTFLTLLAKYLADDGQSVLIVDADLEAPSLDTMLNVSADIPEQTLMGLCGWADDIAPISRAYVGQSSEGLVDLLACRPRTPEFDMDFAAFALGAALDTRSLETATKKLKAFVSDVNAQVKYDAVFFDHRTGITSSVLPIVAAWPGPAVLFVRPDGTTKSSDISRVLGTLLSQDETSSGAFVSFSLDPKETSQQAREVHGRFVDHLLTTLSDAMTRGTALGDIDPSELEESWVFWHHDRALLNQALPNPKELSSANQKSLMQLVDVLGLRKVRTFQSPVSSSLSLTRSGASDEGWFILTSDIARLFSTSSSLLYIFGRKGTGKTRLVRELQRKQLGEPLLVASDYADGGLPSGSTAFQTLFSACDKNVEVFWWALLRMALECSSTSGTALLSKINEVCQQVPAVDLPTYAAAQQIEVLLQSQSSKRVFLIDGVETAVPASALREFVEVLFRFMASIQYNRLIASKLTVRLFLRSDLARGANQNVEQQVEGNEINLRWDKPSILNFALGRLATLGWFNQNFPEVCKEIQGDREMIAKGILPETQAEDLLLRVFPKSLERNRLKTTTFLSTYFSDAGGDSEDKASFYPRLFDGFLRDIAEKAAQPGTGRRGISEERLESSLVLEAYDYASGRFMNEVRTELYALLDFDPVTRKNQDAVDKLIDAFDGQKTPFGLEDMVGLLSERATLGKDAVRVALRAMKAMGIFEDRPGVPGAWRTGRLYKSGLRMKYVRG